MLINDVKGDCSNDVWEREDTGDNSEDYKTANELYEIMAKDHHRSELDDNSFITQDLVILYENIDVGVRLISSSAEVANKRPNQYTETVVYNDGNESEDSDIYEIYSNEDLHNVFTINNERMDLLSNMPSLENTLCHKFGKIHMKSSDLSNEYNKHFLFNDLFLKDQLQSLQAMSDSEQYYNMILPSSLLDYISCKRLEDNSNCYMENVIKYVQHTIDQLKRISNGDYLTDKAKEKWRQVKNVFDINNNDSKMSSLAHTTKALIPVKKPVNLNICNDVVHFNVDVRCLRKISEQKMFLQIPKMLCGSYKLFPKQFKNDVILNYKKKSKDRKRNINFVVKFEKPKPDNIISYIDSVAPLNPFLLSDTSAEIESENDMGMKIVEIDENGNNISKDEITNDDLSIKVAIEKDFSSISDAAYDSEANYGLISSDELENTPQKINAQLTLTSEDNEDFSLRKKSPTKIRIKSPYENKSYVVDEKKRKRLLEIREKREKKKLAIAENCKISKHKYSKGAIMAQPSNSVTKLSITNKSFYNSIYGQTNKENFWNNSKLNKQDHIPDLKIQECDEENSANEPSPQSQEKSGQKYVNRSYYLDDADTEVMYLQMKANTTAERNEILSPTMSELSNDVHFIDQSMTDLCKTETSTSFGQNISLEDSTDTADKENTCQNATSNISILVPKNTPKPDRCILNKKIKVTSSVECKKRIDEIYDLMTNITISKTVLDNSIDSNEFKDSKKDEILDSNMPRSDSATSMKRQVVSNPISTKLKKAINMSPKKTEDNKIVTDTAIIPKVIIKSRSQTGKSDISKKEVKNNDNPLKAISQLIHDIDNIQKTRNKSGIDSKRRRKNNNEEINSFRQFTAKASRQEKKIKQSDVDSSRRVSKPSLNYEKNQKSSKDEKPVIKKLADIIDEVKEMRGEAVRGPPKLSSRIDNLAQPKKNYIRAQKQEQQNRLNKNVIPRAQKTSTNSHIFVEKNMRPNYRVKPKEDSKLPIMRKQVNKTENSPVSEKLEISQRTADIDSSLAESEMCVKTLQTSKEISSSHIMATEASDPFNKISADESYLKHHYSPELLVPTTVPDLKYLAQWSRVPLVPTDIDLESIESSSHAEESTALGNKLHDMIHSKITKPVSPLKFLTEYTTESSSEPDGNRRNSLEQSPEYGKENIKSMSDFPIDVFKDKNIITAVACASVEDISENIYPIRDLNNELQRLENALYRQISTGTFQKRLKIKKLTLTPKHSLQQTLVLQSGDDEPIMVKATVSQKLDYSKSLTKLNLLPDVLPNDAINWKLPMQVTTVGYMFPSYKSIKPNAKNIVNNNLHLKENNKTVQCFRGFNGCPTLQEYNSTDEKPASDIVQSLSESHLSHSLSEVGIPDKDLVCRTNEINSLSPENISTSASLDILVGLLNEIKKMTSCPSTFLPLGKDVDTCERSDCSKHILNKDTPPVDHSKIKSIPIISMHNLRQVHSTDELSRRSTHDEIFCNLKSEKEEKTNSALIHIRPSFSEKSINVQIAIREFVHGFTDVPSRFLANTVNRSASVISSIIDVVKRSSHEVSLYYTSQTLTSKTLFSEIKTLLPFIPKTTSSSPSKRDISDLQLINTADTNMVKVIYENKIVNRNVESLRRKQSTGSNFIEVTKHESTIKLKRDILVTVYSILVFTVFVALAVPEILYVTEPK